MVPVSKEILDDGTIKPERPERYISHALVEVRKFRYLPFSIYSAILLDISLAGFKLEFTAEIKVTPGEKYWLSIPLAPLGIFAPKRLVCQAECRWFDEKNYRVGGVFVQLSKSERLIIDHAVDTLRRQGLIV